MNCRPVMPILILTLASLALAQEAQQPSPALKGPESGPGMMGPMAEQRQKMMEMHEKRVAAMQADVNRMKATLEQMKANIAKVTDASEKARWQGNLDLWTLMVSHMEHMVQEMNSGGPGMGPGMMHRGGRGTPSPSPNQ